MACDPSSCGFKLRELAFFGRLGVFCVLLVFAIGMVTSGLHMYYKHAKRDDQAALTVTDIKGVYHGVASEPLLKRALERGHPESLKDADRKFLLEWIASGKISENYDNIDLGDSTPKELLASCTQCHSAAASAKEPEASKILLDSIEAVKGHAAAKELFPNDIKILAASTHAHALALGSMTVCLALLATMTTWRRCTIEFVWFLLGVSLLADIGSWWVARELEQAVYVIIGAGAVYNGGVGLVLVSLMIELLKPRIKK